METSLYPWLFEVGSCSCTTRVVTASPPRSPHPVLRRFQQLRPRAVSCLHKRMMWAVQLVDGSGCFDTAHQRGDLQSRVLALSPSPSTKTEGAHSCQSRRRHLTTSGCRRGCRR